MDDPGGMGGGERVGDLRRDLGRLGDRKRPPLPQHLSQVDPRDELHHDVVDRTVRAAVVYRDDVRMVETGRRARLACEPLNERRILGERGRQHLDRDRTVENPVDGAVDDTHPAPAEYLEQVVAVGDRFRGGGHRHRQFPMGGIPNRSLSSLCSCARARSSVHDGPRNRHRLSLRRAADTDHQPSAKWTFVELERPAQRPAALRRSVRPWTYPQPASRLAVLPPRK